MQSNQYFQIVQLKPLIICVNIENFLNLTPASRQWRNIGIKPRHGICFPLFSVRTEKGTGIGEYNDLIPCISWLKKIGFDVLQLLPINDTHGKSSPYSPVSAHALNPIHLSLNKLPNANRTNKRTAILQELLSLNCLKRVDYPSINRLKEEFLEDYYRTEWGNFHTNTDFRQFLLSHQWLKKYALFKTLASLTDTLDWSNWKEEWKNPENHWDELFIEHAEQMNKYYLIQFFCFQQMEKVKRFADSLGILIKGDCPILIDKESADAWAFKQLFKLNFRAGAPPDYYNPEGQDWGFPLYNWDTIANDDYQWWKSRLETIKNLYHLYRLDHVVGFYRIWATWTEEENNHSGFFPADSSIWIEEGEKILKTLLQSSSLLPIAEDLGTVPDEVKHSLKLLGICGTKVIRWEKQKDDETKFIPFEDYNPISMTTLSTHDSETFASWWQTHQEEAARFSLFMGWTYETTLSLDHHIKILKKSHSTPSLFHINLIQEYLSLFDTLVSDNLDDERVNVPGTNLETNWTYRTRITIEEICIHQNLENIMKYISGLVLLN